MTSSVTNRVEQMMAIQADGLELFRKKNHDYGDAFAKYGIIGVLMRMEDKLHRALNIGSRQISLVENEGLEDTLIDLHNYAAMALILLRESSSLTPTFDIDPQTGRS